MCIQFSFEHFQLLSGGFICYPLAPRYLSLDRRDVERITALNGRLIYIIVLFLCSLPSCPFFFCFKILFIYFQREGKGGRKRGRETSMCGCLSCIPYWNLVCKPGTCPDWESNQQPFGLQAHAQSTEFTSQGHVLKTQYITHKIDDDNEKKNSSLYCQAEQTNVTFKKLEISVFCSFMVQRDALFFIMYY